MELARLLKGRTGAEREGLAALLDGAGPGIVDRKTHHTTLPVKIAEVRGGLFRVLEAQEAVPGDPYLTRGTVWRRRGRACGWCHDGTGAHPEPGRGAGCNPAPAA